MQRGKEAAHGGFVAGVFATVFAELARGAVERPRLGYFHIEQLDYDIARLHAWIIVGEMSAYAKRRAAFAGRILLQPYGLVDIKTVAEHHLLRPGIYAERPVFVHYQVMLPAVVAAIDAQALEHIGIVFREVEAEYTPPIRII